jgi:adenylate cyclase
MKRRLVIVVWGCSFFLTLAIQSPLGDPVRALSIDSLIWLRDRVVDHDVYEREPSISIIAVDEATYQTPPFRGTPRVAWSAYLAEVIRALLDAGVTVVGFDIVFPTSLDSHLPGIDRQLLQTLRDGSREGRVILGEILHGQERIQPHFGYRAVVDFERNIRPLDVILDPDGVVRRMPLSLVTRSTDGTLAAKPSMALELAHRFSKPPDSKAIDSPLGMSEFLNQRRDSIINLHQRNINIPTYSLADMYYCASIGNTDYFSSHFANKIVMIGSVLDVEDQVLSSARFISPSSDRQPVDRCVANGTSHAETGSGRPTMPGVYLHAAMVQNLLNGEVIRALSPVAHAVLTLLAVGALMTAGVVLQPIASVLLLGLANVAMTTGAILAFSSNLLVFILIPVTGSIIGYASGLALHILIVERRRRRIRDAFNHLLPGNVVEQLIDRNEFPSGGGKLVTCTVLLTDLENYTGLAEQLKPDELVDILNQVNQVLGEVIERNGGIVSWHAGDSLLALFGAPIACANHAARGVNAALECRTEISRMNIPQLRDRDVTLRIRLGVSTGEILVGYIGSNRQLTYSAIGDHVNIASRLEGLNKVYGTSVLVNESTYQQAMHDFVWREVDETLVKGRKNLIRILEPRAISGANRTTSPPAQLTEA